MSQQLLERFYDKVLFTTDCWEWTASKSTNGYGQFSISHNNHVRAHRFIFEIYFGKIPDGLVIDHLCRNKLCVNPEHMEIVTNRENLLRGDHITNNFQLSKTHCPQGHPYSGIRNGHRICHICRNEQSKQCQIRKKVKEYY